MSNYAALFVLAAIWLYYGRGLNLCLLIICYYVSYIACDLTELSGMFLADESTTYGTYLIQTSIDALMIVSICALSHLNGGNLKILLSYGAIIASSLVLNGLMLYDQMLDLSIVYKAHAIRQEFSIPLDVLFAVLGSATVERTHINHRLRAGDSSNYNRSNSDY